MFCKTVMVLMVALCLSSQPMVTPTNSGEDQSTNEGCAKRRAIAYLLGWESTLLEAQPSRRQQFLPTIKVRLRALGLRLKHPLAYYFHYPVIDKGVRAESFAVEVMALLKQTDPELANHFTVARYLLLVLRDNERSETRKREKVAGFVPFLDIPRSLQQLPEQDLNAWAYDVHDYFDWVVSRKRRLDLGSLPSVPHP